MLSFKSIPLFSFVAMYAFFTIQVIQMNIEESMRKQITQELKINQQAQCPYVVVCYQSFYENGVISIILEYMDGGSLADLLKKVKTIPESYLAAICKQVWSKQFPFSLVPIIIFTESLTRSDLFLFSFLTI